MSKRKSLNDVIHGDRADVRAAHGHSATVATSWEQWLAEKDARLGKTAGDFVEVKKMKIKKDKSPPRSTAAADDYLTSIKGKTVTAYYSGGYERCYHNHPAMPLPGVDKVVYGGSCSFPAVTDADVYIALDAGFAPTAKGLPWRATREVYFPITDMSAPKDVGEFKTLVEWTKGEIDAGKKVHIGCIGGHGRTGTLLAALAAAYGEKDAIAYVRKHYCHKAVESQAQINFLAEHFGVHKVSANKGAASPTSTKSTPTSSGATVKYFAPIGSGDVWGGE
jgi:hypothetical protein